MNLHKLIRKYKINQGYLAKKIGMHPSTFKQKLSSKFKMRFTEDEENELMYAIREYATDVLNFACNYTEQKNK